MIGERAEATAEFAETFDKFFDSLKVQSFTAGQDNRNPFKHPYCSLAGGGLRGISTEVGGAGKESARLFSFRKGQNALDREDKGRNKNHW